MGWDEGYFSEIPYLQKCYRELSPSHLQYALLNAGYEHTLADDFTYCELGSGQGVSLCIHAAATANGRFFGTDFMPEHAYFAQKLASSLDADVQIFDHSFADFFDLDLPEFDVIAMHGVWSWVSEVNRNRIVDFVRRKLKVGGIFYIGYNALPGWSQILPLRNLLVAHDRFMASPRADMANRIENALKFAENLSDEGSRFFALNPAAKRRIDLIKTYSLTYVAHEYFNDVLEPMYFHEVNDLLASAKVTFACSANLIQQLDAVTLPRKICDILDGIGDDIFRETVRGYAINEEFRRDIFVKGLPKLTPAERNRRLAKTSVILVENVSDGVTEIPGPFGKVQLRKDTIQPLLDALADDGGRPKSIAELAEYPELANRPFAVLAQNIAMLVSDGWLAPVQPAAVVEASAGTCARLNRELFDRSETTAGLNVLASPVTGGAVAVSRIDQLFLSSHGAGHHSAKELSKDVWKLFKARGRGLRKGGEVLSGDKDNLAFLLAGAESFLKNELVRYQALGIADKKDASK